MRSVQARQLGSGLPETGKPRICMATARNFAKRVYRCSLYEAQDVLLEIDDVDLINLEPRGGFLTKFQWHKRLLYRDMSKRLIFQNPGLHRVRLNKPYELFVAVCQNYSDLLLINAVEGWKDLCKTSVCWLDELWAAQLPSCKYWLHALRRFDHVFIGCRGTVDPLSTVISQQCHWLPGAVDVIRFSPYPNPVPRFIDVYSIGRRLKDVHQALLGAESNGEIFYVYDTVRNAADMEPDDHKQHRTFLANMTKRSRYFMVAPAKLNVPSDTQGQIEVGYRYFEGAAAGAIMIGTAGNCEAFRDSFPWPDAVLPVRPDGSDVMDVLRGLNSQPDRVERIIRRNSLEALLRHDWSHRWKKVFEVAGIRPSPKLTLRERRLSKLATLAGELNMRQGLMA